jgi:drug/metabolite transporter (DMT)-like permease
MNVGLLYTPVSIYQMTRGALVLFVGTFSVAFLRRRLALYQWLALLTVMAGVALVGLSGSMVKDALRDPPDTLLDVVARALIGAEDGPVGGDLPPPEQVERPEATKVLIGVFFILFAQILWVPPFSRVVVIDR